MTEPSPSKPISRLPPLDEPPQDSIVAEIFSRIVAGGGRILNVHRASGHAAQIFRAYAGFAAALRHETNLSRRLSEILILRTAQLQNSPYELGVHRRMALAAGVPQAAIDAIEHWQPASFFTPPERAALAYVEQVAKDGIVDDAVFAGLQRHFNPREVTEITALCSYYVGNSRFVKALRIEPESD